VPLLRVRCTLSWMQMFPSPLIAIYFYLFFLPLAFFLHAARKELMATALAW
jgi:hypothetical protein